ncbi:MAG: TonB-dependent receptor [Pseudomonadales bacterium]
MELSAFRFAAASLAFLSLSFGVGTSFAQSNNVAGILEEVIVTATRRAETLQEVPISISVLSADEIVATGSTDLKQISALVPNFVFAAGPNQGISNMSIRGIYTRVEPDAIGFDQSVGVYVDGVYHSRQFNANANMGDVERIEVLRGPQGTLFGRNTISGAINITSKKPDTESFGGKLSVDIGNRSLVHGRGSVNIPIVEDTLAVKLFAEYSDKDGFVDNITTGNDDLGSLEKSSGRFQLRYTPSDQTTVDFGVSSYESEALDYFFEHIDGAEADGRDFTTSNDTENTSEIELFNTSLAIEHEFANGFTLTSVTAFLDDELNFEADVEGTAVPVIVAINTVTSEIFSQEIRIASPADRAYDFVAGLYFDDEESTARAELIPGAFFPFPPVQNTSAILGNGLDRRSFAAFIHANFDVSTQLTLFGGLRYTDETKEQATEPTICEVIFACAVFGDPTITETVDAPVDVTLDELTWTAGLRYKIRDDVMVYGGVGTGVKSGAFNNSPNPVAAFASNDLVTEPEEVTSYELGMKSSWLDNRLNVNLAMFQMKYDDLQVRLGCVDCGPGGIPDQFLSNSGEATSEGFELEMVALPTDSLKINVGVGYNESTYDRLENVEDQRAGNMLLDASGNTVAFAPEWSINAAAQHTAELMGGTLTSRLDVTFVDDRFSESSFHNYPDDVLEAQTLLNARVGYRPAKDNWGVSLWVNNITDDDSDVYRTFGSAFLPAGTNRVQLQEPRTYGLSLDFSF